MLPEKTVDEGGMGAITSQRSQIGQNGASQVCENLACFALNKNLPFFLVSQRSATIAGGKQRAKWADFRRARERLGGRKLQKSNKQRELCGGGDCFSRWMKPSQASRCRRENTPRETMITV